MNILTDRFPEAVEIDGTVYDLDTDFRTGIKIMLAFEDPELTAYEKSVVMLELLYPEIPKNLQAAHNAAIRFLNCGEEADEASGGENCPRLYSFEHDAKYIYSAIRQSHGIDLESLDYMHWWKFCYLFLDLGKDCFFNQMISYRKKMYEGKLTQEEAEYCNAIRDILVLPEPYEPELQEAEDEFMRLLNG